MVKLSDVAAAAGVSTSVASRVLSSDADARISDVTRQRVEQVARDLNYTPNARSRALRFSRSEALGLVIPDVSNSVFAELHAGVEHAAWQRGWSVLLGQIGAPGSDRAALSQLFGRGKVDGVIIQRREDTDDTQLRAALDLDMPIVLFNSVLADRTGSVILPDEHAARIAVEHLVALGHRRIAIIGGRTTHDAARRRSEAARSALADAGLEPVAEIEAGWEAPEGKAAMAQLFSNGSHPTAVFVASVNAALGAASRAMSSGVHLPDELSIIAIQDTWVAQVYEPSMTVVQMPLRNGGELAADMLLDAVTSSTPLRDVIATPAPRLIERNSTRPPKDEIVASGR